MRGFSGEQLLAVADEYCAFHGCHVRSFAALAASAAVPGARLHGVPVFDSVEAAAAALAETSGHSSLCPGPTPDSRTSPARCTGAGLSEDL